MARVTFGSQAVSTDAAIQASGQTTLNGASQTFLNARPERIALFLGNTSATNPMFFALGAQNAVVNAGLRVPPLTTLELRGYTGAVRVRGTAADVLAYAEI